MFFPEKRAFFLEGPTSKIRLGIGGQDQFIPFLSRELDCWAARKFPSTRE